MDNPEITGLVLLMISHFLYILLFAVLLIILNSIFKDTKNKFLILIRNVINDVKFSFRNPLLSVLIPILVVIIIFSALRGFIYPTETSINLNFGTLVFMIILIVVTGPVAEEIIQCVTISAVFVIGKDLLKNYPVRERNLRIYKILIPLIVIDALYMAYFHDNKDIISFSVRTLCFIIYGFLYILNDRNFVPPVIAHSTWNLLVILDSAVN